jgi:hypothetical protein
LKKWIKERLRKQKKYVSYFILYKFFAQFVKQGRFKKKENRQLLAVYRLPVFNALVKGNECVPALPAGGVCFANSRLPRSQTFLSEIA